MSTATSPTKLKKIPLDLIRESKVALREVDRESEQYEGLVSSIRDKGVMNPIVVREQKDEDGKTVYGLVDGKHRYTAAQDAGLSEIPAQVMTFSDAEVLEAQVIGNVHRVETKPVEYSKQLQRMFGANPMMTMGDMAAKLSKSPAWISQRLSLNHLPKHVGEMVDDQKITLTNAYALVELSKLAPDEVDSFLDRAQTLPPSEFAAQVQQRTKAIKDARRAGRDPNKANEFEPVPLPQSKAKLLEEYKNPSIAQRVLERVGAQTPLDGWKAAMAWTVKMDPESIDEGRRKFEAEKAAQAEAKEKRRAERAAKKQEDAAKASLEAVESKN